MPSRGERAAPTFDPEHPRELYRFFDQLECLFTQKNVNGEALKKKYACRYVTYEVERTWVRFKEYRDMAKTFDNFKKAILAFYPDSEGDFVYSAKDLDDFISAQLATGINTSDELMTFHLHFVTISQWLIDKELMGEIEQRREYIRAFAPPLLTGIKMHLKMAFLKHHPSKPHKIEDVYEAALFTLQDGGFVAQPIVAASPQHVVTVQPVPVAVASSSNMPVKAETFAIVMGEFSKTIADALHQNNRSQFASSSSIPRQTNCNFCGGDHFIRECKVVDEYITAGKVRRNFEGKVVLSTGAFVPRDIPGTYLSERVNEWHHRNPGQLGVATLVHTISAEHVRTHTQVPVAPAFQLSTADRITALEAELFNLRARKSTFTPVIKTRAQRARELPLEASIEEIEDEADGLVYVPAPAVTEAPPRVPVIHKPIVITPLPDAEPEHPFKNAKDASYTPPAARNVGGIVKVPPKAPIAAAPAYRTLPPIHEASIAAEVYKRAMDSPVTITQRELLSLSPEIRGQVRESTTTRRVPTAATATAQTSLQVTIDEEDLAYEIAPAFALGKTGGTVPPIGSTIVSDPIELYYNSLEPGEVPDIDRLTVAKESTAIRSIHALVDTSQKKECTVDPGCQVVAMSESTCHSLSLVYDPRIRLNMESANGTFDWSLGLARNVPFLIGTITLYLQVHVIRSPSYEILLGRPFDVLTESVIRNYTNEDQTITITDPNTEAQCTIPTFARGMYKKQAKEQADF